MAIRTKGEHGEPAHTRRAPGGKALAILQRQNNAQRQWLIAQVLSPPPASTLGGFCSAPHCLLRKQADRVL